jgi:DNA-binding PadR family transcriptional regulator
MKDREPHAVPRGLLRFYILRLLTENPMKGYELITRIEKRTEGVWKPGPGSIYPMIASLRREGLIESTEDRSKDKPPRRGTILQITSKGENLLNKFRQGFKSRIHSYNLSLFGIFAEMMFPGQGLDEVMLSTRGGETERLKRFLGDEDYWKTLSPERRSKFLDAYAKILQEELEVINSIKDK